MATNRITIGLTNNSTSLFSHSLQVWKWLVRDPLPNAERLQGMNLYQYCFSNPVRWIDSLGLDVWIEGPSGNEPAGHQSINVGDPNGEYSSYSFGLNGHGLEGEVYNDTQHGGSIVAYKKTNCGDEANEKAHLDSLLGKKGIYGVTDICRSFSQREFNNAPGTQVAPPNRQTNPSDGSTTAPSSSGPTSSTGTWTSR